MSWKKLLLFGFIGILLIATPVTLYFVQQQQQSASHATASTTLSFLPDSSPQTPLQETVGQTFPLDINVNPGNNLVSFIKVEIDYDPSKIATSGASPIAISPNSPMAIQEGPIFSDGKIQFTLSIGFDTTKAISKPTSVATATFKAIATTDGTPTLVSYNTTVTSVSSTAGPQTGSNDQASENVLSSANPAAIIIADAGGITPTTQPTTPPTGIPPTGVPTTAPTAIPTAIPTGVPTGAGGPSLTCNSLTASPSTSGVAPYTVTLTALGVSTTSIISQVTFNYGDGTVDIASSSAGGIGTSNVNIQDTPHTYSAPGTYQAMAILTDANGQTSNPQACTQTITVTNGSSPVPTVPGTATPTIAKTGPGDTFVGAGIVLTIITVVGGLLFFAL